MLEFMRPGLVVALRPPSPSCLVVLLSTGVSLDRGGVSPSVHFFRLADGLLLLRVLRVSCCCECSCFCQIPSTLAPTEVMERYTQIAVNPLHKTNKPGILSLDIHISKDIIATAGADSNALVFDRPSGQVVSTLSGHSKKVTSVKFVGDGDLVVTGSALL